MRSRTSAALLGAVLALAPLAASAAAPPVALVDAHARAAGNRRDIAIRVGDAIFARVWPAEVSQVSANAVGRHLIVGIRVWGVKFHTPLTRAGFVREMVQLVATARSAAPEAEEVDLWASIPIPVKPGTIVSGDLAQPTSRVVYSLSARRSESLTALATRALGDRGVYWDRTWAATALRAGG